LHAHQQGLGFGITEPAVELEHLDLVPVDHQSGIKYAFVRTAFRGHAIDHGDHHFVHDALVKVLVHYRRG
jgi:hypothetical protein